MNPLKVLILSSEVAPYAKTGGLGDVTAALGRHLHARGHEVAVVLPLYARVREALAGAVPVADLQDIPVTLGPHTWWVSVSQATLPDSECPVLLVRCPPLYERPDIYTQDPDEPIRFQVHARAALEICRRRGQAPDVLHLNDWQGSLVPLALRTRYAGDPLFARTRTLLTIHNLGYQGVFGKERLADLDLEEGKALLYQEDLEAGHVNFLKTGILYADWLTTVSETYAREIQQESLGMGLDRLLRARADHLTGIVNGVDYHTWDPRHDPYLEHPYSAEDLAGKQRTKEALCASLGLQGEPHAPLAGIVARLTWQKGFEVVLEGLPQVLRESDLRLAVLGSGEARYEERFQDMAQAWPGRVAFVNRYDEALAHRVEAASDLFLMPSRYEPCGLNQMYSLRYGTAPVVRRTGGLADTVEEFDPDTGEGTGFLFDDFTADALAATLRHALGLYRQPKAWDRLRQNAMAKDWSWDRQIGQYERLYRGLQPAEAGGGPA